MPANDPRYYSNTLQAVQAANATGLQCYVPYMDRSEEFRELLFRIRQWDMLDRVTDGAYWKQEIDKALSPKADK